MNNLRKVILILATTGLYYAHASAQAIDSAKLVKNLLVKDVWVIEKICYYPEWSTEKDSCVNIPIDSNNYYQFSDGGGELCSGYGGKLSVTQYEYGFIMNPISDRKEFRFFSCPSVFWFLEGNNNSYNIIVCGEHWPYYARLKMLSDATFKLTGVLMGDQFRTEYYRRIPIPEFMKKQ